MPTDSFQITNNKSIYAAGFDAGSSQVLGVPTLGVEDMTEGFVSSWLWRSGAQAADATIIEIGENVTKRMLLAQAGADDDDLKILVRSGASHTTASSSDWLTDEEWHHVIVRWDATNYWLYVDGDPTPVIGPIAHGIGDFGDFIDFNVWFGGGFTAASYWTGRIDNSGLFTGAWNSAYLAELYNEGSPLHFGELSAGLSAICAGYWHMDEDDGEIRADETGTYNLQDGNTVTREDGVNAGTAGGVDTKLFKNPSGPDTEDLTIAPIPGPGHQVTVTRITSLMQSQIDAGVLTASRITVDGDEYGIAYTDFRQDRDRNIPDLEIGAPITLQNDDASDPKTIEIYGDAKRGFREFVTLAPSGGQTTLLTNQLPPVTLERIATDSDLVIV